MIINVRNKTKDFNTYRAARVKSLFNAHKGDTFELDAELPIEDMDWRIGLVVGPSGSGKTSIGRELFGGGKIIDLYEGWDPDKPIVDQICPDGDFNVATGALSAVGLGDVPAWLRPFQALSNGQQFRAGLARVITDTHRQVISRILDHRHIIVGVSTPISDMRVRTICKKRNIPVFSSDSLDHASIPGFDLGVNAYSTKILSGNILNHAEIGWIGYHPSLLPRHRGLSSIEWAIRMKDLVTGGTVYWLDEGIDTGDIERQQWVWLDHSKNASEVWRQSLQPIGIKLLAEAVNDISRGVINRTPQDERFATYEPALYPRTQKTGT